MWQRETLTLSMGMKISTVIIKLPENAKNSPLYDLALPRLSIKPEEIEPNIATFPCVVSHNSQQLSHRFSLGTLNKINTLSHKEWNPVICHEMTRPGWRTLC